MSGKIEQVVEKVVAQVLDGHVSQLRQDLVRQVLEEVRTLLSSSDAAPASNGSGDLAKAIASIHAGSTQREILRSLLDNMPRYCGRAALFVVKSGNATGWQGRGFANNDGIKDFGLDVNNGGGAHALQTRTVFNGTAKDMGQNFTSQFGVPADAKVIVLPLLLKDKVAALVYADAGAEAGGQIDSASLEVLVLSTSAWLEVASSRKQVVKEGGEAAPVERVEHAPQPAAVSSHNDPFASHAPRHAAATAAHVEEAPVAMASAAAASAGSATSTVPADPYAGMSAEDADTNRKAQRFARLLVDEIKLYNQVKVSEGRKTKDLYDRLKEDIEKSRGTYTKRYGTTAAASIDHFNNELVRSLAEDDVSIMGANFKR